MKINVTNIKMRIADIASAYIDQGLDLRANQTKLVKQAIKEYLEDNFDISDSKIHKYIQKVYDIGYDKLKLSSSEIEQIEYEHYGTDVYNDIDDVISSEFDDINYSSKSMF